MEKTTVSTLFLTLKEETRPMSFSSDLSKLKVALDEKEKTYYTLRSCGLLTQQEFAYLLADIRLYHHQCAQAYIDSLHSLEDIASFQKKHETEKLKSFR